MELGSFSAIAMIASQKLCKASSTDAILNALRFVRFRIEHTIKTKSYKLYENVHYQPLYQQQFSLSS